MPTHRPTLLPELNVLSLRQSSSILVTGIYVPLHPWWRCLGSGPCPSTGLHVRRHRCLIVLPLVGGTRTGDLDVTEVERPAGEVVRQSADAKGKHRLLPDRVANRTVAPALGGEHNLSARRDRVGPVLGQYVPGSLRRLRDPHHDWRRAGRDDLGRRFPPPLVEEFPSVVLGRGRGADSGWAEVLLKAGGGEHRGHRGCVGG